MQDDSLGLGSNGNEVMMVGLVNIREIGNVSCSMSSRIAMVET
jgi:hypothetical protein